MTLALLLDGTGELDQWGLDCAECLPVMRRERGCGKAPWVPGWTPGAEVRAARRRPFTPRWWREICEKTRTTLPDDMAEQLWPHADRGEAIAVTGSPWRCCPAWYARFSPESTRRVALRAYELHDWRETGSLSAIQSGELLDWQVDLIGVVSRARAAHAQRRIDAARESSGGNDGGH